MTAIVIDVHGLPGPQGSKRHVGNGVMVESSAKVKPWRQDVRYAARLAHDAQCGKYASVHFPRPNALAITVRFYLPRPKGHYGTGRNADRLKATAPTFPATKPDVDKLLRSTLDALGDAGIWDDDSQVVAVQSSKDYADDRPVGALIKIGVAT